MKRVLLVPAAGHGTRLGSDLPKLLAPIAGAPMIDHILNLHRSAVAAVVLVVAPSFENLVRTYTRSRPEPIALAIQPSPTGMLDAILAARDAVLASAPDRVWITWCDQVGISTATINRLIAVERDVPDSAVVMPTTMQDQPYIHFDQDASGRLTRVRQRREGDAMPERGLSDAGLFSLSREAFDDFLPRYSREGQRGRVTGERNFLPFLPWLSSQQPVTTFLIPEVEARGVNTPEDLAAVEQHLLKARGDAR